MFAWDADVGLQVNLNLTAALDVAPGRMLPWMLPQDEKKNTRNELPTYSRKSA